MSPKCPECAGPMKWQPNTRRYACEHCGLSLTRIELDDLREKIRYQVKYEKTKEYEKEKHRKEYLDWYLSKKENE
jgi:tRNA(Ile2) C34 agmatinyltransferase TiaS